MIHRLDLSLADARAAIDVMRAECEKRNAPAVFAVADSRGDLIALERMDNAPLPSITVATNKAYSAAREKTATRQIGQRIRSKDDGFDVAFWGDPKMLGWGGGIPVFHDGQLVGAVAVSGLPEAVDEEIAALGVNAIQSGASSGK